MATTLETKSMDVDADAYRIVSDVSIDFPEEIFEFAAPYARQRGDNTITVEDVGKAVSVLIRGFEATRGEHLEKDPRLAQGLARTISLLKRIEERCIG